MSNYDPMRVGEVDTFTADFASQLSPGETISLPVWNITVAYGCDANASAMIVGAASISGSMSSQMIQALVPGVSYAPKCTVHTSAGRSLIAPRYGDGLLEVTL